VPRARSQIKSVATVLFVSGAVEQGRAEKALMILDAYPYASVACARAQRAMWVVKINQGRTQTCAQLLADCKQRLRVRLNIHLANITKF
jgi:hypothetical protein